MDTGTSLLYIATEGFQAYTSATGASLDDATGLVKIANPDNLQSLFFQMGNVSHANSNNEAKSDDLVLSDDLGIYC